MTTINSFFERNAVMIKVGIIGFLALVLLIPTAMISSLVNERQNRQNETIAEISSKWGTQQLVTGPILAVPYQTWLLDKDRNRINIEKHIAYFLPENLNITSKMLPETRKRGIFRAAVYTSNMILSGNFSDPSFDLNEQNNEIDWKGAFISIGITDLKGINDNIKFVWNNLEIQCQPGVRINKIVASGVTVSTIKLNTTENKNNTFSIEISLNGTKSLSFTPIGKETNAKIESSWVNPSFDGAFLPKERSVNKSGFNAEWKVLELNRNFPQSWIDNDINFDNSAFGVSLLLPIETYQVTERSIKYAILFISLTFMLFFFIEVMKKHRVHPIQYVLVGFSLSLFYLLLLSLSEHIGFDFAYLVASIGIISMISGYGRAIFKSNKLTIILAAVITLLYGFLYILLQLQDYALLVGSLGLFIVLGTVMYFSRKIDWYSIGAKDHENA